MTVDTAAYRAAADQFILRRARQLLANDLAVAGDIEYLTTDGIKWGCRLRLRCRKTSGPLSIRLPHDSVPPQHLKFQLLYVYSPYRASIYAVRPFRPPIIEAMKEMRIVWFDSDGDSLWGYHPHTYACATDSPKQLSWAEYRTIAEMYGERYAKRSKVPYMNHIDEGLAVMSWAGAGVEAMKAFCLHPLYQSDEDFGKNVFGFFHPFLSRDDNDSEVRSMLLAVEYRAWANRTLSSRVGELRGPEDIPLPPIREVRDMLVGDKVQNYKDFLLYHSQTHPRRHELDRYFRLWLERLEVSPELFAKWFKMLQVTRKPLSVPQVAP